MLTNIRFADAVVVFGKLITYIQADIAGKAAGFKVNSEKT